MKNNITIIIPTSPIPSHPCVDIIEKTIFKTREYTNGLILVLIDGIHSSLSFRTEDYENYKAVLKKNIHDGKYGDCKYIEFTHHRHQSEMTKTALGTVDTSLVMFMEHDVYLDGDMPFEEICQTVEHWDGINYIRFNIFDKIPESHMYLMLDMEPVSRNKIPLTHTLQWSQRPHIAKTNWYRDILWTYFKEGERMMIEDRMHSIVQQKYKALGFDTFGLYIYTPEGNQLRSFTSDGRKDDPKIIEA